MEKQKAEKQRLALKKLQQLVRTGGSIKIKQVSILLYWDIQKDMYSYFVFI